MKQIFFICIFLSGLCLPAHSGERPSIDLQSLVSILAHNYDGSKFLGQFNLSFQGLPAGVVSVVIEKSGTSDVFKQDFDCIPAEGSTGPACTISSLRLKVPPVPYDVSPGPHLLKFIRNNHVFFSLPFQFHTVERAGYQTIYITGPWDRMAILALSGYPAVGVNLYSGSPSICKGPGVDAQVHLLRNGKLVGRGHIPGVYHDACSTNVVTFSLFYENSRHFTQWVRKEDITQNEGDYELVFFKDQKPIKRYIFNVVKGTTKSLAPADLPASLHPEGLSIYHPDIWIYATP